MNGRDRRQLLDSGMLNTDAGTLGRIAGGVAARGPGEGVGDEIDRGLILARLLKEHGYEIVKVHNERCNWGSPGLGCNCIYLPKIAQQEPT